MVELRSEENRIGLLFGNGRQYNMLNIHGTCRSIVIFSIVFLAAPQTPGALECRRKLILANSS